MILRYINASYRRQLLTFFILTSVVPFLLGGWLLVYLFRQNVTRTYEEKELSMEQEVKALLLHNFAQSETTIDSIEEDPNIQKALSRGSVRNPNVYAALYRETDAIRDNATIDIYSGSVRVYSTQRGNAPKTLPLDMGILKRAADRQGNTVYSSQYDGIYTNSVVLQIARKINDNDGFVVITVGQENFDRALNGLFGGEKGLIIANRFWEPVYTTGSLGSDETLQRLRSEIFHDEEMHGDESQVTVADALGDTGLNLIYLAPPALSDDIYRSMLRVLLFLSLIVSVFSIALSGIVSNYLAKPLTVISRAMQQLRHENYSVRVDLPRDDEFGELAAGFNKTAGRIADNLDERVRQQKKLNETEIAMVQAQLNPHFLYNTLDTIKWVAKDHDVPEIAALSSDLAAILRRSISGKAFVTLSDQLDLLDKYCAIQQFRFDDSFTYEFVVPEELMDCVLPKLIIQPVVENAIIHGLEGIEDGFLKLEARHVDKDGRNDLIIRVTDNGHGISDEMIDILKRRDTKELRGHLGFNNVNTIIRLYYGDAYGIEAARLPDRGTSVTITLPYSKEFPEEITEDKT